METIGEDGASEAIAIAMSSRFGVGGSAFRTATGKTMLVDTIPFPAYTREVVESAVPTTRSGAQPGRRVQLPDPQAWRSLLLAADVNSRYYSRATLRSRWRQYFGYGFWKVRVLQKHPRQMSRVSSCPGSLWPVSLSEQSSRPSQEPCAECCARPCWPMDAPRDSLR